MLFAFTHSNAQLATVQKYLTSSYSDIIVRDDVVISAKTAPGKNSSNNATIYWQIKNKINKPVFLDGYFKITGKPISGTLSDRTTPAGKNKSGGALPSSKVDANSTTEFETPAEWINDVDAIVVTLVLIHKGDNIKSGNGN